VKVYLVSGKKCIAKAKTLAARKTLDPLYQQMLAFREPFQGCILQVSSHSPDFSFVPSLSFFLLMHIICILERKTNKLNNKKILPALTLFKVTVWGDYGRIEGKKVFMGVAQIMLDNLNLSHIVIGWYKLFGTTSLVPSPANIGLGSRRSSIASLDSLKL
jgi:regulating synaptic membrane exocytosis protein 2